MKLTSYNNKSGGLGETDGFEFGSKAFKLWEMSACTKFLSALILLTPYHFDIIKNDLFREILTTHLGQPSPTI